MQELHLQNTCYKIIIFRSTSPQFSDCVKYRYDIHGKLGLATTTLLKIYVREPNTYDNAPDDDLVSNGNDCHCVRKTPLVPCFFCKMIFVIEKNEIKILVYAFWFSKKHVFNISEELQL